MTRKQTSNPDAVFEALETVAELVSFHATAIEKLAHVTKQLNRMVDERMRTMSRPLEKKIVTMPTKIPKDLKMEFEIGDPEE